MGRYMRCGTHVNAPSQSPKFGGYRCEQPRPAQESLLYFSGSESIFVLSDTNLKV